VLLTLNLLLTLSIAAANLTLSIVIVIAVAAAAAASVSAVAAAALAVLLPLRSAVPPHRTPQSCGLLSAPHHRATTSCLSPSTRRASGM
jgi:hypothetical protein